MRITLLCLLLSTALGAQPQEWLERADSLSELGQYEASNELLDQLLANYPKRLYDSGEACARRSVNYLALGDLDAARRANDRSAKLRLRVSAEQLGQNDMQYARIHLAAGELAEALERVRQAGTYPYMDEPLMPAEVKLLRARILAAAGQHGQALLEIAEAKDIIEILSGPDSPLMATALLAEAASHSAQGEVQQGLSSLEKAEGLSTSAKEKAALHLAIAQLLQRLGNGEAAQVRYEQARSGYHQIGDYEAATAAGLAAASLSYESGDWLAAAARAQAMGDELYPDFISRGEETDVGANSEIDGALIARWQALQAFLLLKGKESVGWEGVLAAAEQGISALEGALAKRLQQPSALLALEAEQGLFEQALRALSEMQPARSERAKAGAMLSYMQRAARFRQVLDWQGQRDVLADEAASLEVWQKALAEQQDAVLLTGFMGESEAFVLLVNQDTFGLLRMSASELSQRAAALQQALAGQDAGDFARESFGLYEQLLAPLSTFFEGRGPLLLGLSADWPEFPFEALLQESPKWFRLSKFHRHDYLGMEYEVVHLSAISTPPSAGRVDFGAWLAYVPLFDRAAEGSRLSKAEQREADLLGYSIADSSGLLAAAQRVPSDLLAQADGLPMAIERQVVTAMGAVLPTDRATAAVLYHLDMPFFAHPLRPYASGFVTGRSEKGQPAWRRMPELKAAFPNASGFVVSGLPTGHSALVAQALGAAVLLPGDAEAALLPVFYEELKPGESYATALRLARLRLGSQKATAAPWRWVGAKLFR